MKAPKKRFIGIDEVGRGPLAGPVAVGAVISHIPLIALDRMLSGIRDSKKATQEEREQWFRKAKNMRRLGHLSYAVSFVSSKNIDTKGIVPSIQKALAASLKKIGTKKTDHIFLDGGLRAPEMFVYQETIIKGDTKIPLISLAATIAKVLRDKKMTLLAKKYPKYGFEVHKGYGTKKHREVIQSHGPSDIHRKTFLTKIPFPAKRSRKP
jgi:ribonuclease HII